MQERLYRSIRQRFASLSQSHAQMSKVAEACHLLCIVQSLPRRFGTTRRRLFSLHPRGSRLKSSREHSPRSTDLLQTIPEFLYLALAFISSSPRSQVVPPEPDNGLHRRLACQKSLAVCHFRMNKVSMTAFASRFKNPALSRSAMSSLTLGGTRILALSLRQ